MHTVSCEFLMNPEESAECHQTSSRVGSGHETKSHTQAFLMQRGRETKNKATTLARENIYPELCYCSDIVWCCMRVTTLSFIVL